jgi:FixJ family two-component response regulator
MSERLEPEPVVFIVDDDEGLREGLRHLVRSIGLQVQASGSTREFKARSW